MRQSIVYLYAFIILVMYLMVVMAIGQADAHTTVSGWKYDGACCSGRDCAPISASKVKAVAGTGYVVTLDAGDHPLVTAPMQGVIAFDKARPSGDGEYHACVSAFTGRLLCLYIAAGA